MTFGVRRSKAQPALVLSVNEPVVARLADIPAKQAIGKDSVASFSAHDKAASSKFNWASGTKPE
jgi:hypothetical protein